MKDLMSAIDSVIYGRGDDNTQVLINENSHYAYLERIRLYDVNKSLMQEKIDLYNLAKLFSMVSLTESVSNPRNAVATIVTSVKHFRFNTHLKETWQAMGKLIEHVAKHYSNIDLTESLSKYNKEQIDLMEINLELPWKFTFSEPTPIKDCEYPVEQTHDIWKGEHPENDPLETLSQPSKTTPVTESVELTDIYDIIKNIQEASSTSKDQLMSMLAAHEGTMSMRDLLRALDELSRNDSSMRNTDWTMVVNDLESSGHVVVINNKVKLSPKGMKMIGESTMMAPGVRTIMVDSVLTIIHKMNRQRTDATPEAIMQHMKSLDTKIGGTNPKMRFDLSDVRGILRMLETDRKIVNVGDSIQVKYMITPAGRKDIRESIDNKLTERVDESKVGYLMEVVLGSIFELRTWDKQKTASKDQIINKGLEWNENVHTQSLKFTRSDIEEVFDRMAKEKYIMSVGNDDWYATPKGRKYQKMRDS